jgi:hypothetical protein
MTDMENRLVALLQAKDLLEAFLALCAQKGILSEENAQVSASSVSSECTLCANFKDTAYHSTFLFVALVLATGKCQRGGEAHQQDRKIQEGPRSAGADSRTAAFPAYNKGRRRGGS